jgi:hypothetical protein
MYNRSKTPRRGQEESKPYFASSTTPTAASSVSLTPQIFSQAGIPSFCSPKNGLPQNSKGPKKSDSQGQGERISSKEFNEKVYPRFEKFIEDREEKILREKEPSSQCPNERITTEDFQTKVLSRFDEMSKKTEQKLDEIDKQLYWEMTGKERDENSATVTLEQFKANTLSRFKLYEDRARAKKEQLQRELKNDSANKAQTKKTTASKKAQDNKSRSPLKIAERNPQKPTQNQPMRSQEAAKKPTSKGYQDLGRKCGNKGKTSVKEAYARFEDDEMKECTFAPKLNKNSKAVCRGVQDQIEWKMKTEAKLLESRKKIMMEEKEKLFKPEISKNSNSIVVNSSSLFVYYEF